MNVQSFQAVAGALDDMRDALVRQKMQARQEKQQAIENQLKQAMLDWQKQHGGDELDWQKKNATDTRTAAAEDRAAQADERKARADYYSALASGEITRGGTPKTPAQKPWHELSPADQIDQLNQQIQQGTQDFQEAQKQPGFTNDDALPHQMKLSLLAQKRDALLNPPAKPLLARVNVTDDDGTPSGNAMIPADQLAEMGLKLAGTAPVKPNAAPAMPAGGDIPVLTPEQARAAKPGTKFKTTDGRILVR